MLFKKMPRLIGKEREEAPLEGIFVFGG